LFCQPSFARKFFNSQKYLFFERFSVIKSYKPFGISFIYIYIKMKAKGGEKNVLSITNTERKLRLILENLKGG